MDMNAMEDLIRSRIEVMRDNTAHCLAAQKRCYLLGVLDCYLTAGGNNLQLVGEAQDAVEDDMLRWARKEVFNSMCGTVAEEVRV